MPIFPENSRVTASPLSAAWLYLPTSIKDHRRVFLLSVCWGSSATSFFAGDAASLSRVVEGVLALAALAVLEFKFDEGVASINDLAFATLTALAFEEVGVISFAAVVLGTLSDLEFKEDGAGVMSAD